MRNPKNIDLPWQLGIPSIHCLLGYEGKPTDRPTADDLSVARAYISTEPVFVQAPGHRSVFAVFADKGVGVLSEANTAGFARKIFKKCGVLRQRSTFRSTWNKQHCYIKHGQTKLLSLRRLFLCSEWGPFFCSTNQWRLPMISNVSISEHLTSMFNVAKVWFTSRWLP